MYNDTAPRRRKRVPPSRTCRRRTDTKLSTGLPTRRSQREWLHALLYGGRHTVDNVRPSAEDERGRRIRKAVKRVQRARGFLRAHVSAVPAVGSLAGRVSDKKVVRVRRHFLRNKFSRPRSMASGNYWRELRTKPSASFPKYRRFIGGEPNEYSNRFRRLLKIFRGRPLYFIPTPSTVVVFV